MELEKIYIIKHILFLCIFYFLLSYKCTDRQTDRFELCYIDIYTHMYAYISKVKLANLVEGDLKANFSITTTLICRGGCYSFPWIAPLHLDMYLIMLSDKQGGIKYHFLKVFGMTRLRIEPRSPGPLVNTLPTSP